MKTNNNLFENKLAKTKAEKTGEEIRAFAEEGRIELSPELLEAVNGGMQDFEAYRVKKCENCGSSNLEVYMMYKDTYGWAVRCKDCGWHYYY